MDELEICAMSAVQMAEAVKKKAVSPVEITEAVLNRIERLNSKVNAYCTVAAESARKQARDAEEMVLWGSELGPLHGVPVSIKDAILTRGIRTTAGSQIYRDFIPEQNAIVVERLKAAGAIIIGKTNMCEFGWLALTYNTLFGETRNPWNLECSSGGSSGGAAAAVALHMGPIAIGSDAGGSIRVPSSFCGVFGLKPTFGLVPQYPGFPGWETSFPGWAHLLHTGPITNTVGDAALALGVIGGRDDRDPRSLPLTGLRYQSSLGQGLKGLKLAWSKDLGHVTVDPEVIRITEQAARVFSSLGAEVEEADPGVTFPEAEFSMVIGVRMATVLQDKMEKWHDYMDPALVRFLEMSKEKSAIEFNQSCLELLKYEEKIRPFFEKYDLLLTPSVAVPPFQFGGRGAREIAGQKVSPLNWTSLLCPFNITGQPAASVPCGWTDDGLPVGLQIVGRRLDDALVLKAAAAFEQVLPWADKQSPIE